METKTPLPSLGGCSQGISRKIIILFTTMIMSLSTLFLPYPISSLYTTSYAIGIVDNQSFPIALQVRENNIKTIIEEHILDLEQNGYQNITFELDSKKLEQILVSSSVQISNKSKSYFVNAFNFYADYVQLSKDDIDYYFKSIEESDNFINNIKKYEDTNYEIQEKIKKEIGSETKDEALQEAIEKAETAYKAKLRAAAESYTITDLSGISNDALVQFAIQFNGNPYVYGGTSLTNGADCSGFVQSIYSHFGISLPRTATAQYYAGTEVSLDEIQPGDLIFYS